MEADRIAQLARDQAPGAILSRLDVPDIGLT
jgi:hypothetical protein